MSHGTENGKHIPENMKHEHGKQNTETWNRDHKTEAREQKAGAMEQEQKGKQNTGNGKHEQKPGTGNRKQGPKLQWNSYVPCSLSNVSCSLLYHHDHAPHADFPLYFFCKSISNLQSLFGALRAPIYLCIPFVNSLEPSNGFSVRFAR